MPRIDANGIVLNVTQLPQRGATGGVPLVFVHGLAASQAFWYMAGAQLLSRFGPCTLYDLRGHGKSALPERGFSVSTMSDDLTGLMDALGIGRAHVVAHSFGGMIALLTALRDPERIASLVLADVRVRPLQQKMDIPVRRIPPRLAGRLGRLGIAPETVAAQDDGIDYLRTVARIQLEAGDEADEILRALYHHPQLFRTRRNAERWIALTERASFLDDLRHGDSFTRDDLAGLHQPMLVIHGATSTTGQSARALAGLCPNAVLHEVPGAGHFFPVTRPRAFLRPAIRFLRAVGAEEGRPPGAF